MSYLLSFSPFDISKSFAFGIGFGVGFGMIFQKLKSEKERRREHLLSCIRQLATEVRQLRETLLSKVLNVNKKDLIEGSPSSDDDEYFDAEKGSDLSQEEDKLFIEKVDALQNGSSADQLDAYNMLIAKTNEEPNNKDILWRFAKSQYQVSCVKEKAGDLEAQKFILTKGVLTGEAAIQADRDNFQAYKWYGILLGSNIQFMDTQNKIISGYKYKENIEKAVELNPNDAFCHYLLGRYCFEVFMLPWYMRKAAAALFGEPPSATIDEALAYFLKAEELQPGFYFENSLYIGKCYYQKWDYAKAKIWLRKVLKANASDSDTEKVKAEGLELLKKCI